MSRDSQLQVTAGPMFTPGKFFAVRKLRLYLTSSTSAFKVKTGVQFWLFWSLCVTKKNAVLLASYCGSAQSAAVLNADGSAASGAKRRKATLAECSPKAEKQVDRPLVCFVPYRSTQGDITSGRHRA